MITIRKKKQIQYIHQPTQSNCFKSNFLRCNLTLTLITRVDVIAFDVGPGKELISIRESFRISLVSFKANCLSHVIVGVGTPPVAHVILIVSPRSTIVSSADIVTTGAAEHHKL